MADESDSAKPQPLFVQGDLDGFFGLVVDNLIQFLLILGLTVGVIGVPKDLVLSSILPGAALSIVIGNGFYALQAQRLSKATGRRDVTALPYGINTVSLFAFVFLVMLPIKLQALESGADPSDAATVAWQVGLGACLVSGAIELVGSLIGDWIRTITPRAALLSTLAGIAISFIAIDFAVRTFERPLIAILPLAVIVTSYFGKVRLPLRIPGGAWAVGLGTAAAWILSGLGDAETPVSGSAVIAGAGDVGFYPPIPVIGDLVRGLSHPLFSDFLVPVILPMGLFNVLGSLQNIESAEAAGDRYRALPSMAVNGLGSIVAAAFGSCFPTTIYIGHPGWKALGARSGYSILNGVFFAIVAVFGLTSLLAALVPLEAGIAIVLWIGIVITAQAFQSTPSNHAPAVAIGLFPAIGAWGVLILNQTLGAVGFARSDFVIAGEALGNPAAFESAGLHLPGLTALSQGFMLTCIVWAGAAALTIDRRFVRAAGFLLTGAVLSFFGFMHVGELGPSGAELRLGFGIGWRFALGYALSAGFMVLVHGYARRTGQLDGAATD
ncbi:MAG: NCS2 family permease [Myxococcota bacterium]